MPEPRREIHCGDAIAWLSTYAAQPGTSIITSLPDVSELGIALPAWRTWFLGAVARVVEAVDSGGVAIFFQSDIRRDGHWIDKGAMVIRAAEDAGAHVVFHKIVCRRPPGMATPGRPGFTHLVAVSRGLRVDGVIAIPDVIVDAGKLAWVRGIGLRATAHAVRFARDHASAKTILDPFCGVGTVPAVANALGLDAIGIEKARRRCELARTMSVSANEL